MRKSLGAREVDAMAFQPTEDAPVLMTSLRFITTES